MHFSHVGHFFIVSFKQNHSQKFMFFALNPNLNKWTFLYSCSRKLSVVLRNIYNCLFSYYEIIMCSNSYESMLISFI